MNRSVQKLTRLALLTAVALIIYRFELLLPAPVPVPGIKLGLANIVTLIVLNRYGHRDAMFVLFCRVLLSFFFFGHAISLLYSLTGALCSLFIMTLSDKLLEKRFLYLTAVWGALSHNLAQIAVALAITRTIWVAGYLPALVISAILTGLFTGLCAHFTLKYLPKAQ